MARKELVEMTVHDAGVVRAWIDELQATGVAGGWLNLEPIVPDEDLHRFNSRRGVGGWMSSLGPDLPFVTFVPPDRGRRSAPGSIGIQHGAGGKAVDTLAAEGLITPVGWVVKQDHTKRGLVFETPDSLDAVKMLDYVFGAAQHLSPHPLDQWWTAVRYHRS